MRIIGVDPGLNITGYGIIDVDGDALRHVAHGVVRTRPADDLATRLLAIRDGIRDATHQFQPAAAAVESPFVAANPRTALALGHARAAAIIALAEGGATVFEYSPNLIKQTISGYGHGGKSQVAEMVRLQLGLAALPTPMDATDALAVAITHYAHSRVAAMRRL